MKPSTVAAARPFLTIDEFSGVEPAGRSPTSSLTTVITPGLPQRAFSSATAASIAFWMFASTDGERRRIRRAHVELHPAFERNRVHRRAAADAADVERRPRLLRHLQLLDLGDRASHRAHRVGHAERAEAVAARALEGDAIAMAADRDVGHVHAGAVDRHEPIDLILQRRLEQLLHAAQIAEPFFADVGDEGDRARRLAPWPSSSRGRSRPSPPGRGSRRRCRALAAGCPSRFTFTSVPSGNTVSRCAARTRCGCGGRARIIAEHVADLVDADVLQSELREHALQLLRRGPLP